MKTAINVVFDLHNILINSALKSEIVNGNIYMLAKPSYAIGEEVVISNASVSGEKWQKCTAEVNIYVPNMIMGNESVPSTIRLSVLAKAIADVFADSTSNEYSVWLSSQTIEQDETNSFFIINNRLELRAINTI